MTRPILISPSKVLSSVRERELTARLKISQKTKGDLEQKIEFLNSENVKLNEKYALGQKTILELRNEVDNLKA